MQTAIRAAAAAAALVLGITVAAAQSGAPQKQEEPKAQPAPAQAEPKQKEKSRAQEPQRREGKGQEGMGQRSGGQVQERKQVAPQTPDQPKQPAARTQQAPAQAAPAQQAPQPAAGASGRVEPKATEQRRDSRAVQQPKQPDGRANRAAGRGDWSSLNDNERQRIRASFRGPRMSRDSLNFTISVGRPVPRYVRTYPVPRELWSIYPSYRRYVYILVGDEILVINPRTHRIVAVLPA
jgi:hypothetical protein